MPLRMYHVTLYADSLAYPRQLIEGLELSILHTTS